MKNFLVVTLIFLAIATGAKAQKGNNQLQVGGQAALPVGRLNDVAKTGFGIAAKGMYGFGVADQQVTLEAGYNRFAVKNLPNGVTGEYSAIPIYTGYRYIIGGLSLEPQAGISFNKIVATAGNQAASGNETNFGWATSVGYSFSDIELSVRYQSSDVKNSDVKLTFLGFRLAYNFKL